MLRLSILALVAVYLSSCVISDVGPDVDPYSHQVRVGAGWYTPNEDDNLPDQGNGLGLEVGGTWFTNATGPLAIDAQIAFAAHRYDTIVPAPPFGSIDRHTDIATSGLEFGPRLVFGRHRDLRAFVRGGFGVYQSEMRVDANASGINGDYDDDDFAPGAYAGFGFEGRVQRVWIGLEWRWTFLEGDFGGPFNVENVDLGGGVAALTFGFAL